MVAPSYLPDLLRLAAHARQRCLQTFDWEFIAQRYEALLLDAVSAARDN